MPLRFKDYKLYDSFDINGKSYQNLEEFTTNIERSIYNKNECVILGNLNFKTHIVGIKPIRCKSLSEAFKMCVVDYKHISVRLTNGYILLDVNCGESINNYEIHLLNNKGISLKGGDYSNPCYHKSIRGNLF